MPVGVSGESAWRRSRTTVLVASPAAGADWSSAVPGSHLWQLLAVKARLVTSAVVANRAVRLILGDGVQTFAILPAAAVQAATATVDYTWVAGTSPATVDQAAVAPLPLLTLQQTWTIGTSTRLVDVADQWSAIVLLVTDTLARRGRLDLDTIPDMLVGVVELGPDAPAS